MKKLIYISGIVSANLMMFGSMFKVQHWPGASVLLALSVFIFCFVFLPSALVSSYNSQEEKKYKALYIVTFVVFFTSVMGILFKVQHWPGASIFLMVGIPMPFVLFLPVYFYQTRNDKKSGNTNFLGVMFGLTFLAVISVLLALNVSRNIIDKTFVSVANNEIAITFNTSNTAHRNINNNVKQHADELCAYIDNLKCELLSAANNNLCDNNKPKKGYAQVGIVNNLDNSNIAAHVLLGNDEHTSNMGTLKSKIAAYKESLLASGSLSPELTALTKELFNVDDTTLADEPGMSWEQRTFSNFQLFIVMNTLTQIQSNVRLVEAELSVSK